MFSYIPLMATALIAYNGIVFAFGGIEVWELEVFSINMVSGAMWRFNCGDGMITLGMLLLFFEILKATRIGKVSIVDHLLSTLVFVIFLVEFLLVDIAASSVFFILTLIVFIDVMAGFSVSIRTASRDVTLGDGGGL